MSFSAVRPPILDPCLGWVFACSQIGAAHVRNDIPCQDAYSSWAGSAAGNAFAVVAVADGHGDPKHDRSAFGSAMAVEAADGELRAFCRNFGSSTSQLRRSFKEDFPRRVGIRWRNELLLDSKRRGESPPSPEAFRAFCSRYGTTLLTALVTPDTLLLGQIGDGDILWLRPDGSIEIPIKQDEELLGSETLSMSSMDAPRLWRTSVLDRGDGGLLLMATDGLANAVAGGQLQPFIESLMGRIDEFGFERVASSIPSWLANFSSQGSGDDITLALVSLTAAREISYPTPPVGEAAQENLDEPDQWSEGQRGDTQHSNRQEEAG